MVASDAVASVCERIDGLGLGRPMRVAVDGITAVGKTTFADVVAEEVGRSGRSVIRVSMDGFHHRRAVRYRQGRGSAVGYYEDAYDMAAVRRVLLDPLGPGGDLRYRRAVIDLATDTTVEEPAVEADPNDVLVVDGSFLQKPVLRGAWDLVVYLRASFAAAGERGATRDAASLGGIEAARRAFRDRYHAAQRLYLAECNPETTADVLVDVEDPTSPQLVR